MISEVEPELDDFIPAVNASHLIQFFPILSEQIMRKIELLFFYVLINLAHRSLYSN